jgi:DNA-binding beta-propeller fold protein YncE
MSAWGHYPFSVSPDGQWVAAPGGTDELLKAVMMYPVGGGSPKVICRTCAESRGVERGEWPAGLSWSPDGKFLYLKFDRSTYAITLRPGQVLPPIPASGLRSKEEVAALPGVRLISDDRVFPGPNPSVYAFTKVAAQRNIYRVPVP